MTDYFYDVARVDSLYFALALGGAYIARFGTGARKSMLAAFLFFLSFIVKQPGLLVGAAFALFYLTQEGWRRALLYSTSLIGLVTGATLLLHWQSGGWSTFYVFGVTSSVFSAWQAPAITLIRLWGIPLGLALGLAAVFGLSLRIRSREAMFYGCFGAATIIITAIYFVNYGAALNGLIPPTGLVCILAGIGLHRIENKAVGLSLGLLQLVLLVYNPLKVIPSPEDVADGMRVAALLREQPGRVYSPDLPRIGVIAGKGPMTHFANIRAVLESKGEVAQKLREELQATFGSGQVTVMTAATWCGDQGHALQEYLKGYQRVPIELPVRTRFWTRAGWQVRPDALHVPRKPSSLAFVQEYPPGRAFASPANRTARGSGCDSADAPIGEH